MNTITASTQTEIAIDSPLTYLTTFQNDTTMSPFMFAFSLQQNNNSNSLQLSDLAFQAQYVSQIYNPATNQYSQDILKIDLETCTPTHFSNLAGVQQNFGNWSMNNWLCLPLNQKYELGGYMSGNRKYLSIEVACNNQNCLTSQNSSILINSYTFSTCINPYNNSMSSAPYI